MEFQILGPLEVLQGGTRVSISGRRERSLLGFLLLSPNQVVSSERVVEDLWSDSPPERAFSALHVCISRLRKALGDGGDDVLVTRAPGYVLRVGPDALDAARFETLFATGQAQAARGEYRAAADTFREALALWRGPALADLADLPAARVEAARLEEARLSALDSRIEADLACGRHGELVGELEALTRAHPLRERFWAQRMSALYRSGRQAEALRAYQELRALLSEELGLEPSSHLRRLERAMLRQDPEVDWTPGVPWTRPDDADASERGVITRVPFVGRKAELSRLEQRLAKAAGGRGGLVLVAGEPGIGKTRLVEELAEAARDAGVSVLWGRCVEGEWAPPYAPFMEALEALAGAAAPEQLRSDLGVGAAPLAGLVPRLRRVLPDLPEAHPVQPDEARFRLLDAMSQLLLARSMRAPVLLCLDDLH